MPRNENYRIWRQTVIARHFFTVQRWAGRQPVGRQDCRWGTQGAALPAVRFSRHSTLFTFFLLYFTSRDTALTENMWKICVRVFQPVYIKREKNKINRVVLKLLHTYLLSILVGYHQKKNMDTDPDPNPAISFGSDRIRIHKTGWILMIPKNIADGIADAGGATRVGTRRICPSSPRRRGTRGGTLSRRQEYTTLLNSACFLLPTQKPRKPRCFYQINQSILNLCPFSYWTFPSYPVS